MTSPLSNLVRYLGVQATLDAELNKALEEAAEDVEAVLKSVKGDTLSANVQRIQYNLALRTIRRSLHELFLSTGHIIRDNRKDAAIAALDAQFYDERNILKKIFPDVGTRENYKASLRQTAQRNVESTIARIYLSQRPLSERVYKTEALANGWIRRTVNSGLARGASAKDIATMVSRNIRPDVPGGVAYAAKRLGRTELNNAFHAQTIVENENKPWVDHMEWFLSKVHEKDDCLCEVYAKQKRFDKRSVPTKPHPNCRCYVVPVMIDPIEFEHMLLIGTYDTFIKTHPNALQP
jgi:hypothetical protein